MKQKQQRQRSESGYAMLAMLAGMTIALIVLAAAAAKPSVQFQSQRENEEEMMYRAVQVANAIKAYAMIKDPSLSAQALPQSLPTKLEVLEEEFNINGKKLHLVRHAAMIDPLTNGEWVPVRLGDPVIRDFIKAYMQDMAKQQAEAMSGGGAAAANVQQQQQGMEFLQTIAQLSGINMTNVNSDDENRAPTSITGLSIDTSSDSRPIIGVISKSKKRLIRNYYGIDNYAKALFIAGLQPTSMTYTFPGFAVGGGVQDGSGGGNAPRTPTLGPCQRTGVRDPRCGPG